MLVSGKQTQWLDYLPARVLGMTATVFFSAVAMEDGSVNVYTSTGRKCVSVSSSVVINTDFAQVNANVDAWISVLCYGLVKVLSYGGDILWTIVFLVGISIDYI